MNGYEMEPCCKQEAIKLSEVIAGIEDKLISLDENLNVIDSRLIEMKERGNQEGELKRPPMTVLENLLAIREHVSYLTELSGKIASRV